MKKIGILTIPRADNYGSVLQAFAVQKFIDNICNDNEMIDFVPRYIKGRYPLLFINNNSRLKRIVSILKQLPSIQYRITKKKRFEEFRKNIRFSERTIFDPNKIKKYSIIVVGSDQLWNTRITNYEESFFLDFANKRTKKIAFSISFGYSDRTPEEIEFYKKKIKKFDYISVREEQDLDFVKSINKRNVENLLDPTLLVDKNIWYKFIKPNYKKTKYILIYTFKNYGTFGSIVNKVKQITGLNVLRIDLENGIRLKDNNGFKYVKKVGPIEFLNLIFNSSLVITDSYHGTCFSIIFEKNFYTIPYEGTENRMISLLSKLNLQGRIIKDFNDIKSNSQSIDYDIVNEIIKAESEKAMTFMSRALNSD